MKTILITGASRGIGKATAELFLDNGWKVIGTSTTGSAPIEHTNFSCIQMNQSDDVSIAKAADQINSQKERIDLLFNNAAVLSDLTDEVPNIQRLRETLQINLIGIIDFTERILGKLSDNAIVVNMSSSMGTLSRDDWYDAPAYRISKAAINMYTKTLAGRVRNRGMKVVSLDPGWVKTDMGGEGALRDPREVADEVMWLATHDIQTAKFYEQNRIINW